MRPAQPLLRALAVLTALACPAALAAQDGFLFRPPQATISVRFGQTQPALRGAVYDDMRDLLTLDRGDFAARAIAIEALVPLNPRLDLGLGFQWSESAAQSEFRDLVFPDRRPIEQTTMLRRVPITFVGRFYPLRRGEHMADYVWVPARFTPFLGVGGGILVYRLEQSGYFVDHVTYDIFRGEIDTAGSALAGHVLGGADFWVLPRLGITAEGRYTFASTTPGSEYNYSSIDLSGFQVTAGLSVRF